MIWVSIFYSYILWDGHFNRYVKCLEEKCRKASDDNIADVKLENLDNEYFRWEEYQFNKALLHT